MKKFIILYRVKGDFRKKEGELHPVHREQVEAQSKTEAHEQFMRSTRVILAVLTERQWEEGI